MKWKYKCINHRTAPKPAEGLIPPAGSIPGRSPHVVLMSMTTKRGDGVVVEVVDVWRPGEEDDDDARVLVISVVSRSSSWFFSGYISDWMATSRLSIKKIMMSTVYTSSHPSMMDRDAKKNVGGLHTDGIVG